MARTSTYKTWDEEVGLRNFGNQPVLSPEMYAKIKFVYYKGHVCRVWRCDVTDGRLTIVVPRTDGYPCNHVAVDRGEYTIAAFHFSDQEIKDLSRELSKKCKKRKVN
jgi:hypothetical protein